MKKIETKYTKGEWKSRGYDCASNGYIDVGFPKGSITVYGGCTNYMDDEEKQKHIQEAEANAKLIAAAPELLESLIKMCEYHEKNASWDKGDNGYYKAKQAINKALK